MQALIGVRGGMDLGLASVQVQIWMSSSFSLHAWYAALPATHGRKVGAMEGDEEAGADDGEILVTDGVDEGDKEGANVGLFEK